jgi:hypothetical protein
MLVCPYDDQEAHTNREQRCGRARQAVARGSEPPDGQVEVSTNGRVIVISPVRTKREVEKFKRAEAKMHAKFAGAFARLAK